MRPRVASENYGLSADRWAYVTLTASAPTTSPKLIAAIEYFIHNYNERAQPFVWTKTPDQILAKPIQKQDTSETLH